MGVIRLMNIKVDGKTMDVASIEYARYLFKKAFEEDEDFRHSYQANIAMLLYDRYDMHRYDMYSREKRNEAANKIMEVIFDGKDVKKIVHDYRNRTEDRWELLDL